MVRAKARSTGSMPNLKSFDAALQKNFMDNEPVDVTPQMAIENGLEKFVDFRFFPLNFEFDPAVNQILHAPDHVVSGRNGFDGKAETNSLYASFV
jgi:hypothetical protein